MAIGRFIFFISGFIFLFHGLTAMQTVKKNCNGCNGSLVQIIETPSFSSEKDVRDYKVLLRGQCVGCFSLMHQGSLVVVDSFNAGRVHRPFILLQLLKYVRFAELRNQESGVVIRILPRIKSGCNLDELASFYQAHGFKKDSAGFLTIKV